MSYENWTQVEGINSIDASFRHMEQTEELKFNIRVVNWLLVPGNKAIRGNTPTSEQIAGVMTWMEQIYFDVEKTDNMMMRTAKYRLQDAYTAGKALVPEAANYVSLEDMYVRHVREITKGSLKA
jgi:hypothetical protein